jgi:hypothetical protein
MKEPRSSEFDTWDEADAYRRDWEESGKSDTAIGEVGHERKGIVREVAYQPAPTPTADERVSVVALTIWPWYAPGYVYDPDAEVSTWHYLDRAADAVAALDALAAPSLGERDDVDWQTRHGIVSELADRYLARAERAEERARTAEAEVVRYRSAFERANIAVSVREDEIGALRERVKHAEGYCIDRDDAQHCEHWWDGEPCCDCHRGDWEKITTERDAARAEVKALGERIALAIEAERDRIRKKYDSWLFTYGSAVEPGSRDLGLETAMDTLDVAARIARETTL